MATTLLLIKNKIKMLSTKASCRVLTFAKGTQPIFSVVLPSVIGLCRQLQVFNSVIKSIFVYVMDYFVGLQISTNRLLHYKTMLSYISKFNCKRVISFKNKFISRTYKPTSFVVTSILPIQVARTFITQTSIIFSAIKIAIFSQSYQAALFTSYSSFSHTVGLHHKRGRWST